MRRRGNSCPPRLWREGWAGLLIWSRAWPPRCWPSTGTPPMWTCWPPVRTPGAARWAVDLAIAASATVIYVEDLRSMEARGMGRTMNTRLSQAVRGQIVDRIRHLAAEAGIAVVTVPARGTSRHCPQCLEVLRHRRAPDRPATPGWKWAVCDSCGWQGDRDEGAWRRIAARGLTHQSKTVTDHTRGAMAIRTVIDKLEAGAVITPAPKTRRTNRSKTGPTRRHPARPTPRRRRTPSPANSSGPAGQRPEGHAHTDRGRLPRAAHRHQSVTTTITPISRHRPRGTALGAGFHLHVHATPPRWAEPELDTTSDLGSPSWSETLPPGDQGPRGRVTAEARVGLRPSAVSRSARTGRPACRSRRPSGR
ncbi:MULTISPECIES: zinc ribbon domain-containing protein [Streptomyces]|nr:MULTISPECIES: zinc ribbon domain-containing protein [Streptomyces]